MYDGCLVVIVEDVGILYGWKSGFGRFVGYIERLWFSGLEGCTMWLWFGGLVGCILW